MYFYQNLKRSDKGQSLTELAANLVWMVPLLLALFDLSVIFICASANDRAVRDAARAAAAGRPLEFRGESPDIEQRAKAVLTRSIKLGGFISIEDPDSAIKVEYFPDDPSNAKPDELVGGHWPGRVDVRQEIQINLPVQVPLVADQPIKMHSMASFPITRIEPPDASLANPP